MTDPAPEIPFPFDTNRTTGQSGHTAHHNKLGFMINQLEASAPTADLARQSGVDPTGVAECSAALQTALNGCLALGVRAYARGTYKTNSTLTVAGAADLSDATLNYTGTSGVAVRIGTATSGGHVDRIHVRAPHVIATAKTTTGWTQVAATVGVELSNLAASTVIVPRVRNFETGLRTYGKGQGSVHNTVTIGHLENNKINQKADADSTGWSNQNLYLGGRFSHEAAEGSNVTGTRHIEMVTCPNPVNTNSWVNPSIEGDTAQYHVNFAGSYNVIDNGRWEATGGGRVRWQADAARNEIRGGYGAETVVQTKVTGAILNRITSTGSTWYVGSTDKSVLVLENQTSSTVGADAVMDAGAHIAGADPATAYRMLRTGNATKIKRATDTYDRMILDHDNGRIYFGTGAATPTAYLSSFTAIDTVKATFHLSFVADNTYDIGWADYRPRDLLLGRNAVIGGALDHNGTTVGFYGATPVTQPAANPDTSGATLANLEIEVNQLKAALRAVGIIAT